MLHTCCSHRHAQLRAGAGGSAPAFIRRQPRGQPLPRPKIPVPLQTSAADDIGDHLARCRRA
eukprot:scaffold8838_cov85-Isochrysis_galbana.AAC.2